MLYGDYNYEEAQPDKAGITTTAEITEEEYQVLLLRHKHKHTWRGKPETYWFAALAEEFGELGSALNGKHADSTDHELRQIAAICLNWLEMRRLANGV